MKIKSLRNSTRRSGLCFALLVLMALLAPANIAKADIVEIGVDGTTTTNSYLPSNSNYNYSLTQQLYTPEEIGNACFINSIAYYNDGSTRTRTISLYMVNTEKTAFNSQNDWITVTQADLVFSGSVTFTSGTWTAIVLTNPFEYDGSNNLAVIVDDNTGSYSSGLACRVFNSTSYCSMYLYSDYTNYDPYSPTSNNGNRTGVKDQLRLDVTPCTTPMPKSLTASNVTAHEATLTWYAPQNATPTGYQYQYKAGEGDWTSLVSLENTVTSVSLTGLTSDTDYTFRVKALYSNNGESNFASKTFHTEISCHVPTNLQATLTPGNATIASLNWTENGSATNWLLQYATDNSFTENLHEVSVSGTASQDLTDLDPETRYYARVKANCGDGDLSQWSNTVDFKPTNCDYKPIGTGTNTSSLYPVSTNYNYSLTQQVYLAEEIETEGLIYTISFYYNYSSPLSLPNIKLFLKNVTRNSFANSDDIEPLTTDDLVWTGTLSASEAGWVHIDLENPFLYDGVSNLLVGVWDDTEGKLNSNYVFRTTNCNLYRCIYWYNDSNTPNPYNTSSFSNNKSYTYYRNNIQIGIVPLSCPKPVNLQATLSPSDASMASLSFTEGGSANNWVLQYGTDREFAAGSFTEVTTGFMVDGTTITVNLTNLSPETRYYSRVKADCGGGDQSVWSNTVDFKPTNCNNITIGTGTNYSYYQPVYATYHYSMSQQIYTAEDIGVEGAIYSISFYYNSSYTLSLPNIKLFMKNVTKDSFASNTDMEPMTEGDLVWTGTLSATNLGWVTIDLVPPFEYDGESNLLVCVLDETYGKLSSNFVFNRTQCNGSKTIYWYSDSSIPNPYNPNGSSFSKSTASYRNNIQLNILPTTTPRPKNLVASTIAARSATLSWEAPVAGNVTEYQYQYKTGEGEWITATTSAPPVEITQLSPETEYIFRVKAIYANGESAFASTSFTTIPSCLPVNSPSANNLTARSVTITWTLQDENQDNWDLYYTDDDEDDPNNQSGLGTMVENLNQPTFDLTGLNPETTYYVYVRADCGNYNGMSAWSTVCSFTTEPSCWPTNTPTVSDVTARTATVRWTLQDEGQDHWNLYYTRYSNDYPDNPSGNGTMLENVVLNAYGLSGLTPSTTYYVFVRADCGGEDGYSAWSSRRSFTTEPSCYKPNTPSVSDITPTTAVITWTPNNSGSETAWQVSYSTSGIANNGTIIDVEGTPSVQLEGLNEVTNYFVYVRANCGVDDGVSEWSSYTSFKTTQASVVVDVTHPYFDDFENGNNWEFFQYTMNKYNTWMVGSATSYLSNKSMYITYYGTSGQTGDNEYYAYYYHCVKAVKRFHLSPGTYEVSYKWKGAGYQNRDYCRVALVPDDATFDNSGIPKYGNVNFNYNTIPSAFTPLDNGSQLYGNGDYWQDQYNVITIDEEADYKVLFCWYTYGSGRTLPPVAIDDFLINVKVGDAPSDLEVSNIGTRSADLTWTENGTATSWQVKLANSYGNPYDENFGRIIETTNPSLALTGLSPETYYCAFVRACIEVDGEIQYTRWSEYCSFETEISCYPVIDLEVASLGTTTATLTWDIDEDQSTENTPNSWEVEYTMVPRIVYDFETKTPAYDTVVWAVGEESGNHYLYNLDGYNSSYFYLDVIGGGVVTFKAKRMGDETGWIYTVYNNNEGDYYKVSSSSEYEMYTIDLSACEGVMVRVQLEIENEVAIDDITANVFVPVISHQTLDFNQGDIDDYAEEFNDGWSIVNGQLVSEPNYSEAYVSFLIQLGGEVSFSAAALNLTEAEEYSIYVFDMNHDNVSATTITIPATGEFSYYEWDLSAFSDIGMGYLVFVADEQPSLVIDDLSFDQPVMSITQIVEDNPTFNVTGLQQFAFYYVRVRALCGDDDVSHWSNITFMPAMCDSEYRCEITYDLSSPYSVGWGEDTYIQVIHHESGITVGRIQLLDSNSGSGSIQLCDGEIYDLKFVNNIKGFEYAAFTIYAPDGYPIVAYSHSPNSGLFATFTMDCNACHLPDSLMVTNLMPESALVTWQQGNTETTYNVRYRKAVGNNLINEGFENLETGLPTGWHGAYYDNEEEGFIVNDSVWNLDYYQDGAISGYKMLEADRDGLLLVPVQNAGWVSLKVYGYGGGDKSTKNRSGSFAIGVFSGDINEPFMIASEAIKLEEYPSGLQTYSVDLDGYTGYLVVYAEGGYYIDDVMVYAHEPWTTINNYGNTSLSLSNLNALVAYQVQVQSICDTDNVSRWASMEFTTPLCNPANQCEISYVLNDSYGDGWNNAYIAITNDNNVEVARLTLESGSSHAEGSLPLCPGAYQFVWHQGNYDDECSFTIYDPEGEVIASKESGTYPEAGNLLDEPYEHFCSLEVMFTEGWNWWAPTVETNVLEIQDLDEYESIVSEDGTEPTGDLIAGQMYKVLVSDDCFLSLDGEPFTAASVILTPGAHWFGFIGNFQTDIEDVFEDFDPVEGDKVISQDNGFAIYDGENWVGTLTTLVPGKGYVYVSQDTNPDGKTLEMGQ